MSRGPYPILLILAMSLPGAARALGLGDIRIDSGLNEPLAAQIDIVGATRDELIGLTAKVANRDVFLHAGSERPAFLASATFKVGLDAHGRPVLNVRSVEPFTDPVVSLFVDLRWNTGELIREYSLLLDPAGYSPPQRTEPVTANSEPAVTAATAVSTRTAATTTAAVPATALSTTPTPRQHRVGPRDTLRAIVRAAGARTESTAQRMMIAIYRANPHAFDGNINLLRAGVVLDLPTPEQLDAVNAVEAKREVRAQTTAWRMDGRPSRASRLAAQPPPPTNFAAQPVVLKLPAPATTTSATTTSVTTAAPPALSPDQETALQNRVQSLEAELNDMHKQLATEHASIEDLRELAANKPAPLTMAAPADAPQVPQSQPTPRVEVMQEPPLSGTDSSTTPVTTASTGFPIRRVGWLAAALVVVTAALAYARRRRLQEQEDDMAPRYPIAVSPAPEVRVEAAKVPPVAPRPSVPTAVETAAPHSASESAVLEQALERSYLESLAVDSLGIDTDVNAPQTFAPASSHETAGLETVALDAADLAAAEDQATINTAILEGRHFAPSPAAAAAPVEATTVDYDLLDLDATAEHVQHVQMPSHLHDHVVMGERRTNIVDVLKTAIERDPNRRDLRMKLLETYHGSAAMNRRAFLDVVKKLAREQDKLSPEDWKKVVMMGREIAGDDIFFADPSKDDFANCA